MEKQKKTNIMNFCILYIYFTVVLFISTNTLLKINRTAYYMVTIPVLSAGATLIKYVVSKKINKT